MAYLAHDVKGSNLTRTSENKVKTARNLDEHDKQVESPQRQLSYKRFKLMVE